MRRVKCSTRSLLFAIVLAVSLAVSSGTASATSDYDGLLQVTPTLYVYTDGSAKTQKMDIGATWWTEFNQTYAKRVAQNIGWPTDFATKFEDIRASGGSWGVFMQETTDGNLVSIVGTHDPNAYCGFVGPASSGTYQCASNTGYGFVRAEYFTHNSYGGNGCNGSYGDRCSDNGMNAYGAPTVQSGTAGYTFVHIYNSALPSYKFFSMNFDLNYPSGYEGELIPAEPPPAKYVAMGDSFSSGEGNPPFEAGTNESGVNECHRSPKAYPRLLQFDSSLNLGSTAFVACSGATTANVLHGGSSDGAWDEPAQIDELSEDTEVVTITIGGNDVEFSDYAYACTITLCGPYTFDYNYIMDAINDPDFYDSLVEVYETIIDRAPNAQVYVAGYPYLAADDSDVCGQVDLTGAWAVQSQLNAVIEDAVGYVVTSNLNFNIHYVDTNETGSPFIGKHLCNGGDSDFNGLVSPLGYSFHPNLAGQEDYATVLEGAMQ